MLVHEIILKQLGGIGKLQAMLGAKNFLFSSKDNNFLEFDYSGQASTKIIITLNSNDYYDVSFYKKKRENKELLEIEFEEIAAYKDIAAINLKETLEDETGMKLSL